MNSDHREHEAGSFGDAAMIVLILLVVLALFAGIALSFFVMRSSVSVGPASVAPVSATPSNVPPIKKAAETPFADENSPAADVAEKPEPAAAPSDVKSND